MKRIGNTLLGSLMLSVAALLIAGWTSCTKEGPDTAAPEGCVPFGLLDEAAEAQTRTSLTETGIGPTQDRKTSVTLAAYTAGSDGTRRLYRSKHFTSGLGAMALSLEKGRTYTVYALVNMGDMTGSIPDDENGMAALTYTIPAYTGSGNGSVNQRGIPMAGKLENLVLTASTTGTITIPVKRLLAKVSVTLTCEWADARINSAKVFNMNKVLKPFGESAVTGPSDVLDFQDLTTISQNNRTNTLTTVLYVPENIQGTVSGITDSSDKRPDGGNATVSGNHSLSRLTYLEVYVTASPSATFAGSITYRSFLGGNATSDFNIRRNTHYVWDIRYRADGLQMDNWKTDTDLRIVHDSGSWNDEWDDAGKTDLD